MKKQTNKYYWTCPRCGSNNDPGEKCDCGLETIMSITNLSEGGEEKYEQTSEKRGQSVRVFGRYNIKSRTTESGDI